MSRVGGVRGRFREGGRFREDGREIFHWRQKTITSFAEKGEEAISLEVQKTRLCLLLDNQCRPGCSVGKIDW